MSILIGVNDIWHEVNDQNGVDTPKFEKIYSMLIEEIKEALPNIKIIILEPFVLYGEGSKRCYDVFRKGVEERADVARRIANKYDLAFVPLLKQFDDAASDGDTKYWTTDGVHPTAAGHQLIKEELVKAFKTI
jgi:lysophospholipase L1-like esterase